MAFDTVYDSSNAYDEVDVYDVPVAPPSPTPTPCIRSLPFGIVDLRPYFDGVAERKRISEIRQIISEIKREKEAKKDSPKPSDEDLLLARSYIHLTFGF